VTTERDMVSIAGCTVVLGLTSDEADRLARELTAMQQTYLTERQELDGFNFDETLQQRRAWLETSMPVQRVEVSDFAIDRYPVTAGQYAQFVKQTGAEEPSAWKWGIPAKATFVTGISWQEATAYAEHNGLQLPSEAQWELAALKDRRFFPWGDAYFPLGRVAYPEGKACLEWVVGSRAELQSPYGVHDLIGEFGEYTREAFKPYPGTNQTLFDQHFPQWRSERAVRGGFNVFQDSTCVYRNGIVEDRRSLYTKFRCAATE